MIIVRVNSHRAREKLTRLLGYEPTGYFSWDRPGEWREVPAEKLADALTIKGITKSVFKPDLRQYIDWGYPTNLPKAN